MKNILKTILIVLVVLTATNTYAQQEYMVTQYMYNGLSLNPAYAGIHKGVSVSGLWREQWVGIDGAPSTQFVSIHSPLNYRYASLGALVYRDVVGSKTEHTGYFSYAYRIQVGQSSQLSFGLQANLHSFRNDVSRLTNQSGLVQNTRQDDPLYQDFLSSGSSFQWNFGSGLMLHSDRYYVGVAVPQILQRDAVEARLVQHVYASAGYVFNTNSNIVLKPNVLLKYVKNAPVEFDLNLNALLAKILWLGVSFRSELSQSTEKELGPIESVSGLIALQITPQMQIGYAYDFTTSSINTNSHEIMLNYIFNLPTDKIKTPRYF